MGVVRYAIIFVQDSEKEATKQRISELEEMVTQLKDELAEKVKYYLCIYCCAVVNCGLEIPFLWQLLVVFSSVCPQSATGLPQPSLASIIATATLH